MLFEQMTIWKRLGNESAVKYCCFRDCQSGKYAVQSADFFHLPLDEHQLARTQRQAMELFIEISPVERCTWFDTIEQAIAHHEAEFG